MTNNHEIEKILEEGHFVPNPTFEKTSRHRLVADDTRQGEPLPNGTLPDDRAAFPRRRQQRWGAALVSSAALGLLLAAIGGVALLSPSLLNNVPTGGIVPGITVTPAPFAPQIANAPPENRIVPVQPLLDNPPAPLYQLGTLGKGIVAHASLSPDERFLLVITQTNVSVYDAATLDILWSKIINAGFAGGGGGGGSGAEQPAFLFTAEYYYSVHSAGWRDGGNNLLLASGNLVIELDSATGEQVGEIALPESIVYHAFSVDGRFISGMPMNNPNAMLVWDTQSGTLVAEYDQPNLPQGGFVVTRWSPDNTTLAMGFNDGTAVLWDISGANSPRTVGPVSGSISALNFDANGTHLAATFMPRIPTEAAALDQGVQGSGGLVVWDTEHAAAIVDMPTGGRFPNGVAISPDGATLATDFGEGLVLLNAATGQTKTTLDAFATEAHFSPAGNELLLLSNGSVALLNLATGETRAPEDTFGGMGAPAFSPDGSKLAIPTSTGLYTWAMDGGALTRVTGLSGSVTQVDWLPGNRRVVAQVANSVWLLDTQTNETRALLEYPAGPPTEGEIFLIVHAIDVNPQGTLVAVAIGAYNVQPPGMASGTIALLDVETGETVATRDFEASIVGALWSPDGTRLAINSAQATQSTIHVLNQSLETSLETTLTTGGPIGPGAVWGAWSSYSSLLALPDGQNVNVWAAGSALIIQQITPSFQAQSIAFLHEDRLLVSGADTTLWDVATGETLYSLPVNFVSITVSPDGLRMATIEGWDGGVLSVWGIAPPTP